MSPTALFTPLALPIIFLFFFFNDTATTEIYTLSLHDALPIYLDLEVAPPARPARAVALGAGLAVDVRSEEHTSELQSQFHLVCRLLLEKKKKKKYRYRYDKCVSKKQSSYRITCSAELMPL